MNVKIINQDELFDLLDQDGTTEISSFPNKNGLREAGVIIYLDNKIWRTIIPVHDNGFIEDGLFELVEVEPYGETKTKWRVKE